MKILLLEDNKRLSNLIIEALEEKGYKVDWFEDGKVALESIYNGYDCFILGAACKFHHHKLVNL